MWSKAESSRNVTFVGQGSRLASQQFWDHSTSNILFLLMSNARYSRHECLAAMEFYQQFVTPSLGPPAFNGQPANWRSFMTDDYSPLEFSWKWGDMKKNAAPKIRYSFEAIGPDAGTAADPYNIGESLDLVKRMDNTLPNFESSLFWMLFDRLSLIMARKTSVSTIQSRSSLFFAVEPDGDLPLIKGYMVPVDAAPELHQKRTKSSVHEILDTLCQQPRWKYLSTLMQYLDDDQHSAAIILEPFMLSFDCVPANRDRIKVYVRCKTTSFMAVETVFKDHQSDTPNRDKALASLYELWEALFATGSVQEPLKDCDHETSGLLFYFEARPGKSISPKVYLPVKHYSPNDEATVATLSDFLSRHRRANDGAIQSFQTVLRNLCAHRSLNSGAGMLTYISCSIANDTLDITSYISPETYYPARSMLLAHEGASL